MRNAYNTRNWYVEFLVGWLSNIGGLKMSILAGEPQNRAIGYVVVERLNVDRSGVLVGRSKSDRSLPFLNR
jgi:hypothetical protein